MTMLSTEFTAAVGIEHPIVQAPMAGGATTPELVSAVSNAGALGSFAAAVLSPSAIIEAVRRIRSQTSKPFNVNLFVLDQPNPTEAELARAQALLAPYRAALGLGVATMPGRFCEDNRAQMAAVLELAPPVVSFTFGLLDAETVAQFKRAGCLVIGTATTVSEARAWEGVGADFICAQGSEAGAHRGTFLGDFEQSSIGLMALIPQVVAAVSRPVIAAGGIMDGRGVAASLILGAQAAQLGTAFLSCPESGIPRVWKQKLLEARDDGTRLTRAFSGRHARGIVNEFMERMRPFEGEVPAYPVQNALTSEIRQAAARLDRPEFMSLWAGQAASMSRPLPAAQLVNTLAEELHSILRGQVVSGLGSGKEGR
jgi:nitronate monooxygenase